MSDYIHFNPSFTKEGGKPTPQMFSSITFEQNKLETSNFNYIHIGDMIKFRNSSQHLGGGEV